MTLLNFRVNNTLRALLGLGLCTTLGCGDDSSQSDPATTGDAITGTAADTNDEDPSAEDDSNSGPLSTSGRDEGDSETDSGDGGPQEDFTTLELRWTDHAVGTNETQYNCFEFDLQVQQLAHIIGFTPFIDNAPYVHHYVVGLLPTGSGNAQGYDCYDLSGALTWVWTPGVDEYWFPDEAGLLVGDEPQGRFTIRVQVHYNNPVGDSGVVDSSGLDVHLTTSLREHNAGTLAVADVGGINIPGDTPNYEHITTCDSSTTQAAMSGPITLFGSSLHAHEIGSVLWAEHRRNGETLLEFNRDDPFDFEFQNYKPLDDIVVMPGDELVNHCIYDSSDRLGDTVGGPGTNDEMCWNTLLFYPRENLSIDYCGTL